MMSKLSLRKIILGVLASVAISSPSYAEELSINFIANASVRITDGDQVIFTDFPYISGAYGHMTYTYPYFVEQDEKVTTLITNRLTDHFDTNIFMTLDWKIVAPEGVVKRVEEQYVFLKGERERIDEEIKKNQEIQKAILANTDPSVSTSLELQAEMERRNRQALLQSQNVGQNAGAQNRPMVQTIPGNPNSVMSSQYINQNPNLSPYRLQNQAGYPVQYQAAYPVQGQTVVQPQNPRYLNPQNQAVVQPQGAIQPQGTVQPRGQVLTSGQQSYPGQNVIYYAAPNTAGYPVQTMPGYPVQNPALIQNPALYGQQYGPQGQVTLSNQVPGQQPQQIVSPIIIPEKVIKPDTTIADKELNIGNFKITPISTKTAALDHYSYLLDWNGQKIYFAGDTGDTEHFKDLPEVDIAFVSPWLYENARRENKMPKAKKLVIYQHKDNEIIPNCANCIIPKRGEFISIK